MSELEKRLDLFLSGKGAHADFDSVFKNLPLKYYSMEIQGLPYTIWQVLEHIRLAQRDLLDYMIDPDYKEMEWPKDYWPSEPAPSNAKSIKESLADYHADLEKIKKILQTKEVLNPIPNNQKGHSFFRCILLVADHTAYHLGQVVLMRRLINQW